RGCDQRKRLVPVNARLWVDVQLPPPDPILAGCWDAGCKAVVVGDSKARKSFFALQLAVQLASGRGPFLRWSLPKARSVLLVQPEIPAGHFQARLRAMLRGLGLRADALADRLHILNLRGVGFTDDVWDEMEGTALGVHAESLIMDPFYKLLHDGDENLARDVRPILRRLDGLCENTGAGALTVLHTPKGTAGDRKAIDRSAGSGIVARDFDAGLYLGEHAQGDGALVVESVLRAYPPCDAFSIRFDCDAGIFRIADDLAPVARTSRTRTARGPDAASCHAALLGLLASGPLPVRAFDERARERLGVGEKRFRELRAGLLEEGRLATSPREGRPHGRLFIGTPEQIRELVSGWANTNPDCFGGRM
ncbi:MAG: AAA family ATPase, partial [Planctomycetes bacterium]|nr:AAA family ATPase [Planctomycetota bacterium]